MKARKRKNDVDIIVYTKFCLKCEQPDELMKLAIYCMWNDLTYKVVRTSYRPSDHKRATEIWGDEDYRAFVVYDDVVEFGDFIDMITDSKNKLVKIGKRKDGRSVQRLPRPKGTNKAPQVPNPTNAAETQDECQAEEANEG